MTIRNRVAGGRQVGGGWKVEGINQRLGPRWDQMIMRLAGGPFTAEELSAP